MDKKQVIFSIDVTAGMLMDIFQTMCYDPYEIAWDYISDDNKLWPVADSNRARKHFEERFSAELKKMSLEDFLTLPSAKKVQKHVSVDIMEHLRCNEWETLNVGYSIRDEVAKRIIKKIRPELEQLATVGLEEQRKQELIDQENNERAQLKALIKKYGVPKK